MSLADELFAHPIPDLPIALRADLSVDAEASLKLVAHVRAGGLPCILLGPNANFASFSLAQYGAAVDIAIEAARGGPVIFGIGPELGRALDQAPLLERAGLAHIMVLPILGPADTHGTADGIRHIATRLGHGVIVDLVRDNHLRPVTLRKLVDEGAVTAVRYSVPVPNPGDDAYLDRVLEILGPQRVISGAGEGAALDHLAGRGLATLTSSAAALAPGLVAAAVQAIRSGDLDMARRLLVPILEFERIRTMLGSIQVVHDAVSFAGIAPMGPQMPMLSRVKDKYRAEFEAATRGLAAG